MPLTPLLQELIILIAEDIQNFPQASTELISLKYHLQEYNNAHSYPFSGEGKRLRPLLTLLTAGAFGGSRAVEKARKGALAIELLHTYSLIHDDLPCMDNDDLRRGKPTLHKIYNDAKALLIGDSLLTESFYQLSSLEYIGAEAVRILALSTGKSGMIWGQWLDISLIGDKMLTWEQIQEIHRHKTGKLFGACLAIGYLCSLTQIQLENKNFKKHLENLLLAGELIGLSFQIVDDILDLTQTTAELGKTANKDLEQNKVTAITLLGKNKAYKLAEDYIENSINILNGLFSSVGNFQFNKYQNEFIMLISALLKREK